MKKWILIILVFLIIGCGEYRSLTTADSYNYSTVTVTSKITGEEIVIKNVSFVYIKSEKGLGKDGGTGIIKITVALAVSDWRTRTEIVEFSQDSYSFISIPNSIKDHR